MASPADNHPFYRFIFGFECALPEFQPLLPVFCCYCFASQFLSSFLVAAAGTGALLKDCRLFDLLPCLHQFPLLVPAIWLWLLGIPLSNLPTPMAKSKKSKAPAEGHAKAPSTGTGKAPAPSNPAAKALLADPRPCQDSRAVPTDYRHWFKQGNYRD
ncbi:hypothetical protein Salat_2151000 [Sesamum alatum]|uniref:Uncharacterized protein n=1 Tax=Sesamum alatum TaxID=300844 RepID=A0AAE1Y1H5_9LAMI|nr:hypothetical protein Salat_2151000 [Sesamum alatum]